MTKNETRDANIDNYLAYRPTLEAEILREWAPVSRQQADDLRKEFRLCDGGSMNCMTYFENRRGHTVVAFERATGTFYAHPDVAPDVALAKLNAEARN